MMRAVTAERGEDTGHCSACFTGNYPISLDEWWEHKEHEKMVFESMWGS
jgi:hypothetical protein